MGSSCAMLYESGRATTRRAPIMAPMQSHLRRKLIATAWHKPVIMSLWRSQRIHSSQTYAHWKVIVQSAIRQTPEQYQSTVRARSFTPTGAHRSLDVWWSPSGKSTAQQSLPQAQTFSKFPSLFSHGSTALINTATCCEPEKTPAEPEQGKNPSWPWRLACRLDSVSCVFSCGKTGF